MDNTLYIFCDETSYLESDKKTDLILGALTCDASMRKEAYQYIRNLRKTHNMSSFNETKWTKVSDSRIEYYKNLIEYFMKNKALSFRALIASDKGLLNNDKYNYGNYDVWFYKMYYQLLNPLICDNHQYQLIFDYKDTWGGPRLNELREVLCNAKKDFQREIIKDVVQINSKSSELIQLTDLLIGAISYYRKGLYKSETSSKAKNEVVSLLLNYGINFHSSTTKNEKKFNIFIWTPRS